MPGFDWSGPISERLLRRRVRRAAAGVGQNLIDEIGGSQPPAPEEPARAATAASGFRLRPHDDIGSNGWALAASVDHRRRLLLGNPHFREGGLRLWENHLTSPAGPASTASRSAACPADRLQRASPDPYRVVRPPLQPLPLRLDPSDPTVYLVDGEPQPMEATEYSIEVLGDDGALSGVTRTLYRTKHGPVVAIDPLGWSTTMAFAIADANIEIDRVVQQFLGMDRATSLEEFQQVHAEIRACRGSTRWPPAPTAGLGSPTARLRRTSATGTRRMARPSGRRQTCRARLRLRRDHHAERLRLAVDWVDDPAAPAPAAGLLPADQPQLERADFVFNASRYRWTNPAEPLTGFTILRATRTRRPHRAAHQPQLLTETDAAWTIHDLQQALFSDRTVLSSSCSPRSSRRAPPRRTSRWTTAQPSTSPRLHGARRLGWHVHP